MDEQIQAQIERLEAKAFAQGLVLKFYLGRNMPDQDARSTLCDEIVQSLERLYARDKVTEHGHPFVQMAMQEVEALLGPFRPKGPTA